MYGYAASSAAASTVKPFMQPPQTTNPAGQAAQAAAVAQVTGTSAASGTQATLNQLTSSVPTALQSLASPLASANPVWDFLNSSFVNGVISGGYINPAMIEPAIFASMADTNAVALGAEPGITALPPMGSGEGNAIWLPVLSPSATAPFSSASVPFSSAGVPGVDLGGASAGMARGAFVGHLSVPQSWTAAAQVENRAGVALPGGGWTSTALQESSAGVPGMPGVPVASTTGRHFGNGPRYGFQVTVMPRPPAAG